MNVFLICGSRNREGQTARAAEAVLNGAREAGANTELVFLPEGHIARCRQCDDNGWGLCRKEGSCIIDDEFAALVEKLRACSAIVIATPVYYSDLSESLRAFLDRLRRISTHETARNAIAGKPVLGVCVAGGGGGGAPACCVSLEKVLGPTGLDAVDLIPVRRQNLETKLPRLRLAGRWLASELA